MRKLPALRGYSGAVTLLWRPGHGHASITEHEATKHDDDLLTPEETRQMWQDVEAAMLKELNTRAELKRFGRKARRLASNIIEARWVLKNKRELGAASQRSTLGRKQFC